MPSPALNPKKLIFKGPGQSLKTFLTSTLISVSDLERDPSLTTLYFRGLKIYKYTLTRIVWVGLLSSSHLYGLLWSLSPGFLCQVVRAQRVIIVIFSDMWGMHTHNSHLPQLSITASTGLTSGGRQLMKRLKYFTQPMKHNWWIKHESQSMRRVFAKKGSYIKLK